MPFTVSKPCFYMEYHTMPFRVSKSCFYMEYHTMTFRVSTMFLHGRPHHALLCFYMEDHIMPCVSRGVWWLNGKVLYSGARSRGFETYLCRVVSLSKTLYSPKVLVIPREQWLHPDMTKTLLTGTLSLNINKQKLCFYMADHNAH